MVLLQDPRRIKMLPAGFLFLKMLYSIITNKGRVRLSKKILFREYKLRNGK